MTKIERSVLDFLIGGMVYSDGAIMKNLGIDSNELNNIYTSLNDQGYLESYEDFLKHNPEYSEKNGGCCSSKENTSCSGSCRGCSSKGGCPSKEDDIDYSKIKVLTEKAFIFTY